MPVDFTIEAKDECTPAADLVVRSCRATSSEPGDRGGGDASVVMNGPFSGTASLRAWRLPNGPGRVYTIRYEVADAIGNIGTSEATVVVSHSQ